MEKELSKNFFPQPSLDHLINAINESSLSFFPWTIRYESLKSGATARNDLLAAGSGDDDEKENENTTRTIITSLFPCISYLELRRQQNLEFADEKFQEANELLSESNGNNKNSKSANVLTAKAKSAFLIALELVPNHKKSVLGYAKFLTVHEDDDISNAERFVQNAILDFPNDSEVQHYLTSLQDRQRQRRRRSQPPSQIERQESATSYTLDEKEKEKKDIVTKKSSAYKDALMEYELLHPINDDSNNNNNEDNTNITDKTERMHRSHPNRGKKERKRKHSRRHKKRKRKSDDGKKKRKRRRHRYDTSSSSATYSPLSSSYSLSSLLPQKETSINSRNEKDEKSSSKESVSDKEKDDDTYESRKKRRKRRHADRKRHRHKRKKDSKKRHKKQS